MIYQLFSVSKQKTKTLIFKLIKISRIKSLCT